MLNNSVRIGVRKRGEIRKCEICGGNCKNTYYNFEDNNKEIYFCNKCISKLKNKNTKTPHTEVVYNFDKTKEFTFEITPQNTLS